MTLTINCLGDAERRHLNRVTVTAAEPATH